MSAPVDEQVILDALHAIPRERWGDVLRFIDSLNAPPPGGEGPPIRTSADVLSSGMVGLWADRPDVADPLAFARRLRHESSHRREDPNAP